MQTGDKVTIRRGKLKGQAGEVIAHQDSPAAYVLKLGDGTHHVVNTTNVVEPTEATITQNELAALVNTVSGPAAGDGLIELVHAIDAKYPGFAGKVGWTASGPARPVAYGTDAEEDDGMGALDHPNQPLIPGEH